MINNFKNKYFFLSNFYESPITYNGLTYRNNEAAFQAQKTLDDKVKKMFIDLTALEAKRKGRRVKLRSDWESVKIQIMYEICAIKFQNNEELGKLLMDTKGQHLEEGNNWGDTFWGTVNGKGMNNLGKILMNVRLQLFYFYDHKTLFTYIDF